MRGIAPEPPPVRDITGARVLVMVGDSVTTDHISPAGSIAPGSPAAKYLTERGLAPRDFNSYGSRRGNHEVMVRGTFANVRLRNELVPGIEGGWTRHFPDEEGMAIYDAAMRYQEEGVPLIVITGKEYGTGSSRDWAAKGVSLLGVRAVIAESYERIHRSNLVGMGVLPLEFAPGFSRVSLGLTGAEVYHIEGLSDGLEPKKHVVVRAVAKTAARPASPPSPVSTAPSKSNNTATVASSPTSSASWLRSRIDHPTQGTRQRRRRLPPPLLRPAGHDLEQHLLDGRAHAKVSFGPVGISGTDL